MTEFIKIANANYERTQKELLADVRAKQILQITMLGCSLALLLMTVLMLGAILYWRIV